MESGSRRKQLRPARVEEDGQSPTVATVTHQSTVSPVEMNTTNGTRTPTVDDVTHPVFENNVKSEVDDETGIEMMSGETRGPYPVKELRASSSEAENAITVSLMGLHSISKFNFVTLFFSFFLSLKKLQDIFA